MKYFGSNIRIDGSSLVEDGEIDEYERQVHRLISNSVNQTDTGRALLRAVGRAAHTTVTVKPKIEVLECDSPEDVNAYVEARKLEDASKKGRRFWDRLGQPVKGTGLGSDTTIYFTPDQWRNAALCHTGADLPPGFFADDVFVHEIMHALRDVVGVSFQKRVVFQKRLAVYDKPTWEKTKEECRSGKLVKYKGTIYIKKDCYPNIEEWFAVLIQNIYRSECGKPLRVAYTRSFGNYTEKQFIRLGLNRAHMRQFRREHRDFFSDLREIDVAFNPTRLILDL